VITNERGIALIITLLVVALLTITVIEFTYSVEVDQHMARNALNGVQASLLARSGINLGEAYLLHDQDRQVDAFTEDWCPQADAEGRACLIDDASGQLVLPGNMRLRVQIIDEMGKLNINATRPPNVAQWRQWHQQRQSGNPATAASSLSAATAALGRLLEGRGVDPQIADNIADYWDNLFLSVYGDQTAPGTPAQTGALATPTPTPGGPAINAMQVFDFPSLDDASVIPGMTADVIRRMRPVLTALPGVFTKVNINTAPREVLRAIVDDDSWADEIIQQRQDAPLNRVPPAPNPPAGQGAPASRLGTAQMLGTTSVHFLIRASAMINPNPVTGLGGISRSASMLVRRVPGAPRPGTTSSQPGAVHWTLTQLDWQKEGGAALFQPRTDQDLDTDGQATPGMGG